MNALLCESKKRVMITHILNFEFQSSITEINKNFKIKNDITESSNEFFPPIPLPINLYDYRFHSILLPSKVINIYKNIKTHQVESWHYHVQRQGKYKE